MSVAPDSASLAGRRVLVMGLGVHGGGLGVTRYLIRQGARVTVTDLAPAERLEPSLEQLRGLPAEFVLGRHRERDFRDCDLVIRNPGVPDDSPYLALAQARGIPVETEMGLFWQACPSRKIIGVTGSKGKTTTTRLVGEMLGAAGLAPIVAGNLCASGLDSLHRIGPDRWVVLELSSWQLEGLRAYRPRPPIAVLTSLYPEHLDRHGSFEAYRDAKGVLFRHQEPGDVAIVDGTRPASREFARGLNARIQLFGPETLPGDWSLRLLGEHNRANAAAALLAAGAAGVAPEVARETIARFGGLPHRLQLVAQIGNVRYYDDGAATNPEAAAAALRAIEGDVVWIAGGKEKGTDFRVLTEQLQTRVRAGLVLPGTAECKILDALAGIPALRVASMEDAVERAVQLARPGDAVLLAPAAGAGYFALQAGQVGQYRHVSERGDRFCAAVRALIGDSRP